MPRVTLETRLNQSALRDDSLAKMEKALITTNDMTALVLCGGAGQRFGGADKPLAIFNGDLGARPIVDYVIHRLPENTRVLISANRNFEHYALRGRVVPDKETGRSERGPLVGIYAGLQACPTPWLLVCPGDMPLLPENWHQPLIAADCVAADSRVLHDGQRLQPLLCLIPTTLRRALGDYIRAGGRSVKEWHAMHNAATIYISKNQKAFVNINTKADLDAL